MVFGSESGDFIREDASCGCGVTVSRVATVGIFANEVNTMDVEVEILHRCKLEFEAISRGHRVICDQPLANGGTDAGMTRRNFCWYGSKNAPGSTQLNILKRGPCLPTD